MAAYALARERRSTSDGHLGACRGTVFHLWRPLGRLPWNSVPPPVVARALAMEHRSTRRGHRALVMERRSTLDSPRDRAYFHRYEDEDLWVSGFGGCRRYGRAGWHIRSVPERELSLLLLPRASRCVHTPRDNTNRKHRRVADSPSRWPPRTRRRVVTSPPA